MADERKLVAELESIDARRAGILSQLCDIEHSIYPSKVSDQIVTPKYAMYLGDCVEVVRGLPTDSIHYSIFSPPFLSLYVYTDDERDMGNSKTDDEFYTHFEWLLPELLRVLRPGRLVTVHCSVVSMSICNDGVIGIRDLPGALVRLFQRHGFIYHSKVIIWRDPLIQAVRTKALVLAHKQISKDATRCAMGQADEMLTFRKPGINEDHVAHGRGFERYIGERTEPSAEKRDDARVNKYSHEVWQRYASPVWMDIRQTDTLNVRVARDDADERHICPLQLQAIARCLELWTNEGETVLSPFAGIGSEGYESLRMGRRFIGVELKESYYRTALRNLKSAERVKESKLL